MRRAATGHRYAVLWGLRGRVAAGGLELVHDGFRLQGREQRVDVGLRDIRSAAIERSEGERLRGLPVLAVRLRDGTPLRIASLEGAGTLHELAGRLRAGGLAVDG